jgi:hypothetical protein
MTEETDKYRRLAQVCRDEAAKAISPIDKDRWLRLADEFRKLARADEKAADEEAQRNSSSPRPQPGGKT